MTYTRNVLPVLVLVLMGNSSALVGQNRPVTVEDCVSARRIVKQEIALSPAGSHVAYIVKTPDVKTNKNKYQLFVRDLAQRARRENGRLLFEWRYLSGLHWLADGTRIAVLNREKERSSVRIIDIHTGESELVIDHASRIKEYSISGNGGVLVFSTELTLPSHANKEQTSSARGFPITFGQPLNPVLIESKYKYELYAVERTEGGKRKVRRLEFSGLGMQKERSLKHVQALNLSPDGNHLLFAYMSDWLPEGWENTPYVERWREFGGAPLLPVRYDLQSRHLRLAFNAPYQFGVTTWAEDSGAYAIQISPPVGSPEFEKAANAALATGETLAIMGGQAPLFAVDVASGSFSQVLPKLRLATMGAIPVWWKHSNGSMLCRLDNKTLVLMEPHASGWKEVRRVTLSLTGMNTNYRTTSNTELVVGVSETPMVPPNLLLYDIKTNQTILLTDLNPEFREIALGQVEELEWSNDYGAKATGFLIKPVGYKAGKRYPLVIMTKVWRDTFLCDTGYQTAFPPQPLANAGFVVLMANRPSPVEQPKDYLGDMGEAYNWMAMVESAVELLVVQGLVDKDKVGLMGFSRTSWKTDFMLTHSDFRLAAASSADSGLYNYGGYWLFNSQVIAVTHETQLGGPPYGKTLQNWLRYAPAFNARNVRTPLLMEYMGYGGAFSEPWHGYEFFTALKRQGKPVELYFYPEGDHILETPWERIASLQRNVDWFRFWMQGYEGEPPDYDPDQYVRWRKLREQHEWNQRMLERGIDPATEFLRQTSPCAAKRIQAGKLNVVVCAKCLQSIPLASLVEHRFSRAGAQRTGGLVY